jgi:hypothetical protein
MYITVTGFVPAHDRTGTKTENESRNEIEFQNPKRHSSVVSMGTWPIGDPEYSFVSSPYFFPHHRIPSRLSSGRGSLTNHFWLEMNIHKREGTRFPQSVKKEKWNYRDLSNEDPPVSHLLESCSHHFELETQFLSWFVAVSTLSKGVRGGESVSDVYKSKIT